MAKQKTLDMAVERKLDTVERYEFEPIKGYPMLHWKGKRPFRGTQYFPAQLKENHGEPVNGWMNRIYWGDNLQVMSHLLKEFRGKVDLVYIDPPFDSKTEYKKRIKLKGREVRGDSSAFEEKQYGDLWTNDEYLQFMYERLVLLRELLAETGSIYVHADFHKVHEIKILMDEVFGTENFKNEIIWKRSNAHSDSGTYGNVHDTLLYYTKTENSTWNQQYIPYTQEYIDEQYRYTDENGKRFLSRDLSASGLSGGGYTYNWKGVTRSWRCPITTMERYETENKLTYTGSGLVRYKQYLEEMPGLPVQSVWDDIDKIHHLANERVAYPTQKPEALLERILAASSNDGDLILDCFMGSGTAQAVSLKMGRKFIGADINLGAVQTSTKRLLGITAAIAERPNELEFDSSSAQKANAHFTGFSVYNVNQYDIFRNELEAKELLIQALEIQPLPGNNLYDGEKDGRMVKVMPVNRIATRADLSALIANFDYKEFDKRKAKSPNKPVESLLLVCMGHEPDLKAALKKEVPYELDVEVVDILRDKQDLQFKREAEAKVVKQQGELVIEQFYPMNLLQKLSVQKETVADWRELVESVMVDWNYDGAVFEPKLVDVPDKNELVKGRYPIPKGAGTIKVKITDLLSESLEIELR